MTGFDALGGISMDPGQAARLMSNPEGIGEMLQREGPTGDSPAEIFADIVNVMRADVRRVAAEVDVELEAEHMSEERAAELLSGTIAGDGAALVEMFNEQAAKRDKLLRAVLDDDDEYQDFMDAKHGMMFTTEPGGFDHAE